MRFELHPNFSSKKHLIDLPLCKVFLENEKHYPWILLVPQKNNIKKIIDLSLEEQILLTKEMALAQTLLWDLFSPTQINVAALGNKTPQLHIHIIARFENDPAWPGAVWDHPEKKPYTKEELEEISVKLTEGFSNAFQEALPSKF